MPSQLLYTHMINLYITLLLCLMAATLYWRYSCDTRKMQQGRASIFTDCMALLGEATNQPTTSKGFPKVQGNRAGYRIALAVIEDTVAMRKVPPLWLTVTVVGNAPSCGSLDIIARPQNVEFYSPSWHWDGNLAIPAGWPQHAIAKYKHAPAPLEILDDFVPQLFADSRVKELLVTPSIVRITYLAKQAERGQYLLMRNALFDGMPINRIEIEALLDTAIKIRQGLENSTKKGHTYESNIYSQ